MTILKTNLAALAVAILFSMGSFAHAAHTEHSKHRVHYHTVTIDGVDIFYRRLVARTLLRSCCCTDFRRPI